ncbi:hypothetical protein WN944_018968 [Citrus x changshan-huyou]|uniref:Uncharacterized protein n=1 Tax=Citrus x changshan-huyou TaxID=2935761 RepID=A0AAP0LXR3_9ROSI
MTLDCPRDKPCSPKKKTSPKKPQEKPLKKIKCQRYCHRTTVKKKNKELSYCAYNRVPGLVIFGNVCEKNLPQMGYYVPYQLDEESQNQPGSTECGYYVLRFMKDIVADPSLLLIDGNVNTIKVSLMKSVEYASFMSELILETFYNGLNPSTRLMIDVLENGAMLYKSYNETYEILERIANNNYQWPSTRQAILRGTVEVHNVDTLTALSAQVTSLTNMVKSTMWATTTDRTRTILTQTLTTLDRDNTQSSLGAIRINMLSYLVDKIGLLNHLDFTSKIKGKQASNDQLNSLEALIKRVNQLSKAKLVQAIGSWRSLTNNSDFKLADRSHAYLEGKIEDVLVKVDKFIFPVDFIMLDFVADKEQVTFNVLDAMKSPNDIEDYNFINVVDFTVAKRLNSCCSSEKHQDQMLDRLVGNEYYCFLDGYSSYNQIAMAPDDQEMTTFTCPYKTFAFRRMSFGLCNAPTTF